MTGKKNKEECTVRAYIVRRLLLMVPTLLILTVIVFLAVRFIPGDIVDAMDA